MRLVIVFFGLVCAALISSCQVLNAPNVPATMSAQNIAFAAEATAIPLSLKETAVVLEQTAVVAGTEVATINSISRQLVATANVAVPSTSTVGGVASSSTSGSTNTSSMSTNALVDIAVTSRKRESDGCADGTQSQFPTDTSIIYATTRATTITAGTVVAVEWKYQGQVVSKGDYTVPQDESNFCIWFPLDPATIPFTAGSWSVQFTLDGRIVEPTIFFNIGEPATPTS